MSSIAKPWPKCRQRSTFYWGTERPWCTRFLVSEKNLQRTTTFCVVTHTVLKRIFFFKKQCNFNALKSVYFEVSLCSTRPLNAFATKCLCNPMTLETNALATQCTNQMGKPLYSNAYSNMISTHFVWPPSQLTDLGIASRPLVHFLSKLKFLNLGNKLSSLSHYNNLSNFTSQMVFLPKP